jgi:uncharacterized protein (TIGR02996 family)
MTEGLKEALESALREDPDDLAAHAAYGDYLHEQGDPRGDFIQTQIALEDASLSPRRRQELEARERELLAKHREEWLGPMHVLFGRTGQSRKDTLPFGLSWVDYGGFTYRFSRGWLTSLTLDQINRQVLEALRQCPTIGLLRDFGFNNDDFEEPAIDDVGELPFLGTLSKFRIGPIYPLCPIDGEGIGAAIAKMPRLEELHLCAHDVEVREVFALPMPNLRLLRANHLHEYPLEVIGDNPTLGNLVQLSCHPHSHEGDGDAYVTAESFSRMVRSSHLNSLSHLELYLSTIGDEGVRALVESGLLRQLRVLDLWSGTVTDDGARMLAASPFIKGLTKLRLSQNFLTDEGIGALKATGVNLEADNMYDLIYLDDPDERPFLDEGDCE